MKFIQKAAALMLAGLLLVGVVPTVNAETIGGSDSEVTEPAVDQGAIYTEVDELVFAISTVNIRSGPGTNYERIGALNHGQSVQRVGIGNNGWSKIIYNGEVCYMFSDYLSTGKYDSTMDTSKLSRLIAIANGLDQSDYTQESVDAMLTALNSASMALYGGTQNTIDTTANALEDAISALVKMDYTGLRDALDSVEEFTDANNLCDELLEAVDNGNALLESGDQAAVDAAAAEINRILEELKNHLEELSAPQIVTQEVKVEVPPSDDYCNIPLHHTWPVLLVISAVLNVALLAVIIAYVSKKRNNQRDDTPLVDYDISDDNW